MLKLEKYYIPFNNLIPQKANIVDIGCGYGFMSYMLGYLSKDRSITGVDYDGNKIEIANYCISQNPTFRNRVNFVQADIGVYSFEKSDVFILSDVLHYMPEEKQEILIKKCIENLNPNGIIIIRDADRDLRKRHWGTKYTEFFSTRSGFNRMKYKRLYFISGKQISNIISKYNMNLQIIDNTKLTSNLTYIIRA